MSYLLNLSKEKKEKISNFNPLDIQKIEWKRSSFFNVLIEWKLRDNVTHR